MGLVPLDEVRRHILESVCELPAVDVPLFEALGLVTAEAIAARAPVPPFANTAMDGYAVRAADTAAASAGDPVRLEVVDELPAGRAPTVAVGPGQAIRIMTGAPIPEGADAIVMVEETSMRGNAARIPPAQDVLISKPAREGDHIRPAGGDVAEGTVVFPAGTLLSPAHVGVAASLDYGSVRAVRRARVGVLSTGDELTPLGEPLAPGRIRDSNRPMLLGLVAQAGCEAVDLGIARDDEATVVERLEEAVATCDALVTSGGVSVGDYDIVKAVLDRMGKLDWFQVAIKPAKPLAFGLLGDTGPEWSPGRPMPIFGLPGNPVSANVSFELFARPALLQMMGHAHRFRPVVPAIADDDMPRRRDGKLHLDRVRVRRVDGVLRAGRTGVQASNVLSAMALANALALLPDGEGVVAGSPVDVMLVDAPADH